MPGSQPVPNWSEFHNDPMALNIRKGIFRDALTKKYNLYLLDGNTKLSDIPFVKLDDAIVAFNNSVLIKVDGNWQLKILKI